MNDENIQTTQSTEPAAGNDPAAVPPESTQTDPETERLRTENETLKRSLQMRDAREAVIDALKSIGAASPDLLFAAIKDELQFDDEGRVTNAAAVAQHLKKTHPDQFGVRQPPSSIDGGAGSTNRTQTLSAESLARMTPAQIQKLDWAEVRRVLSEK